MLADEVSGLQQMLTGWSEMPRRSVGRIGCKLGRAVSLWVQQCEQETRHARRRTKADPRKLFNDYRTQREDVLNLLDAMGCSNGSDILRTLQNLKMACPQWIPAHASIRSANPGQIVRALSNIAAWCPPPTKRDASDDGGEYASADWIHYKHGIPRSRLSEGKKAGKVRSKAAPTGMLDSGGRVIRTLYHVGDAIKHYIPKRTNKNALAKILKNRP